MAPPREPLLHVDQLSKSFGGTQALDCVSLELAPGQVHALVGQNGSGKSTLIKILSGYHRADSGSVCGHGEPIHLPVSAGELNDLGIAFVHQDLALVETMSVLENLSAGGFQTGLFGRIRWRVERAAARDTLARFGLDIDPRAPISALSQAERAIVGIARAVASMTRAGRPGVLVLDEPTASLPAKEVELLFEAIRQVTADGSAVLFVTHDLDEVFAIADRVSVLRDGRLVGTRRADDLDTDALITLVLGRALGKLYPSAEGRLADTRLEIRQLSGEVAIDVDFDVRAGEIVGLTGLIGAGHDEVPYLVYGASPSRAGRVALDGAAVPDPTPRTCKRAGIALLPADRQRQSGIARATLRENLTVPDLSAFQRWLTIDRGRERHEARLALQRFEVVPLEPERQLYTLSGGNQQKTLLARWLRMRPRVLLLHEPAQGVDVGARRGIFQALREAAAEGMSVVYASTEYEDIANLCDRALVFRRGRVVAELAGDTLTHDQVLGRCYQS